MNTNWSKCLLSIVFVSASILEGLPNTVDDESFFRSQGEELMRLVGFTPPTNDVEGVHSNRFRWVKSIDIDGTNIVISCERPDQEFVFWKGETNGRRIMHGAGSSRVGASPRDVAISVFADRVSNSSAPLELLASKMVKETNSDGSVWLVWSVGHGRCAYIKGSAAIWMSGFGSDVSLAKRIILCILSQSQKQND